jgi:Recombination endonuclease VII
MSFSATERAHYARHAQRAKFKTPEEEFAWAKDQRKTCNKCAESLPLTSFGGNTSGSDPFDREGYRLRRGDCVDCNKKAGAGKAEAVRLAKTLGIPYKAPEGTGCAVCGKTEKLVFDHCHETMTFRGYLCDPCNRSMGVLGDNVAGLLRYINYLNKSEKKTIVTDPATGELYLLVPK